MKTGFENLSLDGRDFVLYDVCGKSHNLRNKTVETILRYTATLDSKKRLTLRQAKCKYYDVLVQKNGAVILLPQKLVPAFDMPKKTIKDFDEDVAHLKAGDVSDPIDLSSFKK